MCVFQQFDGFPGFTRGKVDLFGCTSSNVLNQVAVHCLPIFGRLLVLFEFDFEVGQKFLSEVH